MSIKVKRENGEITTFKNAEFIPAFYFIPKSILEKCSSKIQNIPRYPTLITSDRNVIATIESDAFLEVIIDAYAFMVWRFMGKEEYMEIYSGYDPAWKLAHNPAYWIKGLTDEEVIPTVEYLFNNSNMYCGYVTEYEAEIYLNFVVPRVMKKYNMYAAIETAEQFRCFEDFDYRNSRQKIDFHRKWYHTRTQHPMISLESFQEDYAESHNGQEWDFPDESQNIEEQVNSQILVDDFMNTLSNKDKQILELRLQGKTLEEIAKDVGYKTHSAVLKRIRKLGLSFEKFSGSDFGFTQKKIV